MMKESDDMARLMTPVTLRLAEKIRTKVASLDRWQIRYRLAHYAAVHFAERASFDLRLARAMMAIVHNESGGNPNHYVGDFTLPYGPSIGPMQVFRKTAKEEKLWTPPKGLSDAEEKDAYRALHADEDWCLELGVRVFKLKLRYARGDIAKAIQFYNGSGPRAVAYRVKALAFASSRWGDITQPSTEE